MAKKPLEIAPDPIPNTKPELLADFRASIGKLANDKDPANRRLADLGMAMIVQIEATRAPAHIEARFPGATVKAITSISRKIELNDDEVLARSTALVQAHGSLDAHSKHEKEVTGDLKATRSRIGAKIGSLVTVVNERAEYRNIGVIELVDLERGLMITADQATGDVIEERALKGDERQAAMWSK